MGFPLGPAPHQQGYGGLFWGGGSPSLPLRLSLGGWHRGGIQPGTAGWTDRQHRASAPPHGSLHPQQSREPGRSDPPPLSPQNLTSSSLSSAAMSRSPVALKSSTRTSEPLRGERAGGPCPMGTPSTTPVRVSPPHVPSLLVGLVLVEGGLAEPADTGLDAAGGVGPVQVPRHGAAGQHLGPAQPLRVPQAWTGGAQDMAGTPTHPPPALGPPWGSNTGWAARLCPAAQAAVARGPA